MFGAVTLSNNSALIDLDLAANPGVTPLLGTEYFLATINNARVRIDGCRFTGMPRQGGAPVPGVYGVRALGLITRDAVIENSDFDDLFVGIVIAGDIPAIRRNHFRNMQRNAIWILARAGTGPELSLGAEEDPNRGWNTFDFPTIAASVVQNDRQAVILMENNDWSTNSPGSIEGIIGGPADFEPFLAEGSAIFAASMFCTVWAADDQERILNARLELRGSTFGPVSQNVKGVYGFPAIGEGRYTIVAQATGFKRKEMTVDVHPGDFASVTLAMERIEGEGEGEGEQEGEGETEGEGEGDVEPPPPGCCESQGKMSGPPLGDGFIGALTLGVFLGGGLLMRRREEDRAYPRG
ncbi:MAG: carboxypeptidase-like regulatory domain-containing protein [Candidatus Competibacteraceae bacterium]|nr:carboxypeptidase-like regulatory domain-containing protein [Candidatus Competibacteraceae bacterium]